ncbi:MAG: 4Fe-4S dicluster domain-containing protein [Candidatus Thermoplasmatota archaeon]|nr:4Fe-4S dicluster domain-containing protein [Candidatus Thermoplasmatota archaeon]
MNTLRAITKKELHCFVDALIADGTYDVVGVKAKGKRFVYGPLDHAEDLRLDHDVTILPPKKYFLPPLESMMQYDLKKPFEVQATFDNKQRIIIGMHPYDIIALQQTDVVYLDEQQDDFYKKRRDNTIIIGSDIDAVSERSFAGSMNTHVADTGFDVLISNIGTQYLLTIGSEKGKQLVETYAKTKEATAADLKKLQQKRNTLLEKYKQKVNITTKDWPGVLVANYQHAIWEEHADTCLECSSCTMVCPTCFCYDVRDQVSLNLKDGQRVRTWDGCLLRDFTRVGSGEVFREEVKERYRHRFYRKGNYLPARYGFVACVGCGRCGIACLPDIADPCNLINELASFGREEDTERFFIKQKTTVEETGIIHVPRSATVTRVEHFNDLDTFFEIQLDDGKPLGHKPGQFVEISLFGIGEAPFGVSSPPSDTPRFEIMVRTVGNVTSKLAQLKSGDKVGVRGPLGNGFDTTSFEGKNLIFTSGGTGMVPMRSLINFVLDPKHRKKFKNITILYGAKQPKEITFMKDVDHWKTVCDTQCEVTVDRCDEKECWNGCIGLVTTLFPKIRMDMYDSKNTIAIVIGPPIMYKFVIQCLKTMGIPDENIYVSLERRMKCGVGKCGHCQINGIYTCKEGPVFNYNQIKQLPEAFE